MTIEEEFELGALPPKWNRIRFAQLYHRALVQHYEKELPVDWKRCNAAILSAYKMSGLMWIRRQAWRMSATTAA